MPTVGVFGDVDVNLIDGSSVWLVSLCSVLDRLEVRGHVLLKARVDRDILSRELADLAHFRVWEPRDVGVSGTITPGTLPGAVELIDESESLDILIVRGLRASAEVAASARFNGRLWPYLTDIPQSAEDMTVEHRDDLSRILDVSGRVLCQTESLRSFLVSCFPDHDAKMILLPPMVPDSAFRIRRQEPGPGVLRLFYAGKFAPQWGIEEMLSAVQAVRADHPGVSITVAGDKIHDPSDDPGYRGRVETALEGDGLDWIGGVDRAGIFAALGEVDLALSVRDRGLDASREISTKLLEYAAAGVPAIVNRTLAHQELLGDDYPLFVGGPDELVDRLGEVATDSAVLTAARSGLAGVARSNSMGAVAADIRPALVSSVAWRDSDLGGRKIVVAGHDLRFAAALIDGLKSAGADVRLDTWRGGLDHDKELSVELAQWADTIVCEWSLANAVWYSRRKRPDQRLIVRFHRTELNSTWPTEIDMGAVDAMVFVGDHIRAEAQVRFGWDDCNSTVIPNFVDTVAFDRPKLPGAPFTLGVLGFLPRLKRLDRALDILEDLRTEDHRYRLVLKGSLPWDLDWVWNDAQERDYFESQFGRIRSSALLRDAVTFDRAGGDVPSWLREVGVILSLSDIESFHLAMIEGMVARSVPIVAGRQGATTIVDGRWIVESDAEAAERIRLATSDRSGNMGQDARDEAMLRYNMNVVAGAWLRLF